MKKILVIQSRRAPERQAHELECYRRAPGECVGLTSISTLDAGLPWRDPRQLIEGYDGAIMGGSSDFFLHGGFPEDEPGRAGTLEIVARICPLVSYIIGHDFPLLGICFGHQLVAEVLGGNVTHDHAQKKMGTFDVTLNEEGMRDRLFTGMPKTFPAQYAHRDSVTELPHGAVLLASGDSCKFSALRYAANVYTFQFHPELSATDLLEACDAAETYLAPGVPIESVVRESPAASKIISHWIGLL